MDESREKEDAKVSFLAKIGTHGKELDNEWRQWLKENEDRHCDPQELVSILTKNGFSLASIKAHMGSNFPESSGGGPNYKALAGVRITRDDSGLNAQRVLSSKLQLFTLEDFMTEEECDRIVNLSAMHLRPSTVTTGELKYRTSSTSDLSLLDHPDVLALDEKIARVLGIRLTYSEGIQAQRYEVGQEFKQHTDYFQPNSVEYNTFAGDSGQRTWTFMVYLNNCAAGGGTKFWAIDKIFMPRKGMAVIWNNLHDDGRPNPFTVHSGMPVEAGHKIIITKWFRDRGTGSMFY